MRPKLTHIELQAQIVDLLNHCGYSHLHVRRSIGKGRKWVTATNLKGWPDLLAWSPRQPGRMIALELKVPPDDLSKEQREVLAELARSGFEVWVVTEEWIEKLAAALARPSTSRQR